MSESAVAVPKEFAELASMVRELSAEVTAPDNVDDFAMVVMERILSAQSEDEIFAAQESGMLSGQDFLNTPFRLTMDGITWRPSSSSNIEQGGFPFYAILNIFNLENGEQLDINCGGKSLVAVLHRLQKRERDISIPNEDKPFARFADEGGRPFVITGKETGNGGTILFLKPYRIIVPAQAPTVNNGKRK